MLRATHSAATKPSSPGMLLLATLLALTLPHRAAAAPAATQPAYTVLQDRPDRVVATLPNRLIVIVQELHAAPVVSAQVWVKTGSIYEQEHVGAGLSHYLEHLLSGNATSKRTEQETKATLGRIGAQMNAMTGLDAVHYYLNTTRQYAATAVDLLSDWMQNSLITERDFQRERQVIQREFDMGEGEPNRIFWKVTQSARYKEHPARHPTIGYLNEFLGIQRPEIIAFYKRMYVPNNMVFVVVGDVDRHAILKQIAGLWADTPARELPTLWFPIEPRPDKPRFAQGTADIHQPELRLAWPAVREDAEGDLPLDLLGVIMGEGESSRLVRTIRDAGLVSRINAYNDSFPWGEGFFAIDADLIAPHPGVGGVPLPHGILAGPAGPAGPATAPAPAHPDLAGAVERTRAAILAEVQRVVREGVTPEELASAKRRILADRIYAYQTTDRLADRLGNDTATLGDPDHLQHYSAKIRQVTVAQVNAAAARFLVPDDLITLTLVPPRPGTRAAPLTRPADDLPKSNTPREQVHLDNAVLIEKLRTQLTAEGGAAPATGIGPVKITTLPNGLRLLVQRSTVVPEVSIQFFQLGGLLSDEPGHEGVANAVQSMLLKGTATRTAQQINQEIESLGAQVDFECGSNSTFGQADCLKEDLDKVLPLLADVILNPKFPAGEWAKLQPRLLDAIARQTNTWNGELSDRFRATYFGNHTWSQMPMGRAGVVGRLQASDLQEFYMKHLGASGAVLAIYGDVDPDAVTKRAAELFKDLPPKPLVDVHLTAPPPQKSRVVQFQTNKMLAAVEIGFGPGVTRISPDYPAVNVLEELMGSFPSGWLAQALRGNGPGLVYVVGARAITGLVPGSMVIIFNTMPQQVPEAVERSMGVAQRAKEMPVDDDTLARAKASVLTNQFMGRQSNKDRAMDAALDELYGLPADESERFVQAVKELNAPTLQAIAQLYLRNPVVVVLSHQPLPDAVVQAAAFGQAATQPALVPTDKK